MLMNFVNNVSKTINGGARIVYVGSFSWAVLSLLFVTAFSGWNNIFSMLPHEIFILVLTISLPIALIVLIFMLSQIVRTVESVKSEISTLSQRDPVSEEAVTMLADLFREHRDAVAAQVAAQVEATAQLVQINQDNRALAAPSPDSGDENPLALLAQMFREYRETVTAQLEAQISATTQLVEASRDSRDGIVDELRSQRVLSQEITQELSHIAQSRNVVPVAEPGLDPSQRIDRMRALAEVLGLALNDLSMTATQLLSEHLNAAHGDREGTQKFISTLTNAYFAGDKNVFFRSLVSEVVNHSDQLQQCAIGAENVRQQISKILREAREIRSLVSACDPNDLVRIVFEDGELWALEKALAEHFLIDGTPISDA